MLLLLPSSQPHDFDSELWFYFPIDTKLAGKNVSEMTYLLASTEETKPDTTKAKILQHKN